MWNLVTLDGFFEGPKSWDLDWHQDVWGPEIFGSADLSATLMQHRLIDEYRLAITPVILGGGNPLFKASAGRAKLTLVETRPLKVGCVILRLQPRGE